MINPGNGEHLERLHRVMEHAERVLNPHRRLREQLVKDYVGHFYAGMDEDWRKVYANLMLQTAETYTQLMAANKPRVLVSTHHEPLLAFAYHFQTTINQLLTEMHIEETMRAMVLDAFFKLGIVKVYNADTAQDMLVGTDQWADFGKPFVENISIDDFCFDTNATHWRKVSFMANRYRVPYDRVMNDPDFDRKALRLLKPTDRYPQTVDGDSPVRELSQQDTNAEELEPMVDLWDVYLTRERLCVTMPACKEIKPALKVIDWKGPESGPFKILQFVDVPDNILPSSLAESIKPLNDLVNALLRKLARQAYRQKDLPIFEPGSEQDAKKIALAQDGEWTSVARREGVDILKTGGVDPGNHNFLMYATDMLDRMAGNLPLLAGLGAQSDTLGQDQMLQKSGSSRIGKFQARVERIMEEIARDLGYLLWVNPVMEIPYTLNVEEADIRIQDAWTPEQREGDWWQYNFSVEPYSMEYKSPSQRAQALVDYVAHIAAPMQPFMEAVGGYIDIQALTEYWAELNDLPRLRQVVKFQNPSQLSQFRQPHGNPSARSPAETTRNYVRRSIPSDATSRNRQLQSLTRQDQETTQGFQSARR